MVGLRPNANDASGWLDAFRSALASGEIEQASSLFGDECFWRDLVALTWNVKTMEGRDEIAAMLGAQLAAANPTIWRISGEPTQSNGVTEAWIAFETKLAHGRGILRMKDGRAWTLLTAIEELKGFEERKGPSRPMGAAHGVYRRDKTWLEAKRAEQEALGKEKQPYCVVVGGGQGASCARGALEAARCSHDHPGKERARRRLLAQPLPFARLA